MAHKVLHLIATAAGLDEPGLGDQRLDLLLVAGEAEEQVELIAPFQGPAVDRALRRLSTGRIVLELLAGDAVPALLPPLDDVALGLHAGKKLLNNPAVAWIGGANQAVVADLPALPQLPVLGADGIAVGLGAETGGLRRALDLLAMFITAGDEQHRFTLQPLKPRQRIAGQGRVSTAQMRLVVDVVERGGEGVGHRPDLTQPFPPGP